MAYWLHAGALPAARGWQSAGRAVKVNVLFYDACFPPNPYGPSRFNDTVSRGLARCGHSVVVVISSARDCPA